VFWSRQSPFHTEDGICSTTCDDIGRYNIYYLIGPYLAMLEKWLKPQLRDRGLTDDVRLQHMVLTLPPRMIPCGVVSRKDWVHIATSPTKGCAQLLKMPSTPLFHECSHACHRGHEGASDCMSSIKVHIQIHLTCNQEVRR